MNSDLITMNLDLLVSKYCPSAICLQGTIMPGSIGLHGHVVDNFSKTTRIGLQHLLVSHSDFPTEQQSAYAHSTVTFTGMKGLSVTMQV